MALGHGEFLRTLRPLLAGRCWRREGGRIRIAVPPGEVEIRLGPEGRRRLGSLVLPETEVTLVFEGLPGDRAEAFLEAFARAFRRGGG